MEIDQARSVSLCSFFLIINYLTAQYFDKIEQKYQKQKSPFLPLMNQFKCSILHSDHVKNQCNGILT